MVADTTRFRELFALEDAVPIAEGIRRMVDRGGRRLMCGIAGIFDLRGRPIADSEMRAMNDLIRHRGPDDGGQYVEQGLGLANRRLAIIDLSPAGHQPMSNEDGSLLLVYNGELYNFLELVPLLEARGHHFHSKTDTEVIVHAYEEWGPDCLKRFNGMFAFAIWDQRKRELFLARDRFGIKPLYYAEHDGRFTFASEIKSLLRAGVPRRVSPRGARRVLHLPEHPQRPDAVRRRAAAPAGALADGLRGGHRGAALVGPRLRPRRERLARTTGPSGSAAPSRRS